MVLYDLHFPTLESTLKIVHILFPLSRAYASAVETSGKLYIVGGAGTPGILNTVEVITRDPATKEFKSELLEEKMPAKVGRRRASGEV